MNGTTIDLDYAAHADENRGLCLGVLRIKFTDASFNEVSDVLWRDHGPGRSFVAANVDRPPQLVLTVDCPLYEFPGTGSRPRRGFSTPKERPGQRHLRERLLQIYGRCCISGTTSARALDAAHIDALKDERSDNPRNALMLRKDVHKLFDDHLLSIDPEFRTVHVAPALRRDPTYADLDGAELAEPLQGYESCRPDEGALGRHWCEFRRLVD